MHLRHIFTLLAAVAASCVSAFEIGRGEPVRFKQAAAASWFDGPIEETGTLNCVTGDVEFGMGGFVGFYGNPSTQSFTVGTPYYLHVYFTGVGNPCTGTRVYLDIMLPANTSLAVTSTNPIFYFYDGKTMSASESPQTVRNSLYNSGAYWIASTDAVHANTWALPRAHNYEIQIPVITNAPVSVAKFTALLKGLDGVNDEWIAPSVTYSVSGAAVPMITYPVPSTDSITLTSGHSVATITSYGAGGTYAFELGKTLNYELINEGGVIQAGSVSSTVWDNWGPPALFPATQYHWRVTFTPAGGVKLVGADQTFTTQGSSGLRPIAAPRSGSAKESPKNDILGRSQGDALPGASIGVGFGNRSGSLNSTGKEVRK